MKINRLLRTVCISVLLLPAIVTTCTYDNEEEKYMHMFCDTSNVTYSNEIQPILEDNCYPCHSEEGAQTSGSNIVLDNYLAVEGNATRILNAVQHNDGYVNMPLGRPKLDECTLAKIRIWVEEGAANN